jgi:hypothetical protein
MSKKLEISANKKYKSGDSNHKILFSRDKLPKPFRRYLNLVFPLPEIPIWKALFLGNELPSLYRPHLRLISALKIKTGLIWNPSIDSLQLDLTSFCNLNCPNCDRSIRQAPCEEYMSLEQIKKFVDESIELKKRWKAIHILGGEPTLHPQFFEVLDVLKCYKDPNHDCFIEVWTNGYGSRVNGILSKLPSWIKIVNSKKDPKIIPKFSSYNVAPIDLEEYKHNNFARGCWITEICGISLTRYGYYACGAGAAVDRVFGFDIGIKKLSEVKKTVLRNQMKLLCRYCGHYKTSSFIDTSDFISEEKMSVSWVNAYKKYKTMKPKLSLY